VTGVESDKRSRLDQFIGDPEEALSSIAHGFGLVLSVGGVIALVTLSILRGTRWHLAGCSIYGGTLLFLYTASTLYHGFRSPTAKHVLRILDHAGIYLLIAGTYTPFLLVNLRGHWGWTLLALIWGLSLVGVTFKFFYAERFEIVSTLTYIAMGWLIIIAVKPLLLFVPMRSVLWLVVGGVIYTTGVFFFVSQKLRYSHGIWHMFVLAGSACHFIAVVLVIGPPHM
jgi:hemolysin III